MELVTYFTVFLPVFVITFLVTTALIRRHTHTWSKWESITLQVQTRQCITCGKAKNRIVT